MFHFFCKIITFAKCKYNAILRHSQKHIRLFLVLFLALSGLCVRAQEGTAPVLTKICIDAGHGGKDPGCISRDGKKTKEKDITLGIALKVKEIMAEKMPSVKVVLTRSKDTYPALNERADIANKANADLFISIHVNSLDPKKNKNYAKVSGFSVHTLGQSRSGRDLFSSNMELCKRENSVILLEDDYSTKYQGFEPGNPESYIIFNLMQNTNLQQSLTFAEDLDKALRKGPIRQSRGISQDPFLVLWKTTMPSVLLECGFITHSGDLAAMRDKQDEIAGRIVEAIRAFKGRYDGRPEAGAADNNAGQSAQAADKPGDKAEGKGKAEDKGKTADKTEGKEKAQAAGAPAEGSVLYGTQVLASGKRLNSDDKVFQGYTAVAVSSGSLYKYIIGTSTDPGEAAKSFAAIKKLFPDSFFVEVSGGEVKRARLP